MLSSTYFPFRFTQQNSTLKQLKSPTIFDHITINSRLPRQRLHNITLGDDEILIGFEILYQYCSLVA